MDEQVRARIPTMALWLAFALLVQAIWCVAAFIIFGLFVEEQLWWQLETFILRGIFISTLTVPVGAFMMARPGEKKSWYFSYGCAGTTVYLPVWFYLVWNSKWVGEFAGNDFVLALLWLFFILSLGVVCVGSAAIGCKWHGDFDRF